MGLQNRVICNDRHRRYLLGSCGVRGPGGLCEMRVLLQIKRGRVTRITEHRLGTLHRADSQLQDNKQGKDGKEKTTLERYGR